MIGATEYVIGRLSSQAPLVRPVHPRSTVNEQESQGRIDNINAAATAAAIFRITLPPALSMARQLTGAATVDATT
jgi:hypothetical protein